MLTVLLTIVCIAVAAIVFFAIMGENSWTEMCTALLVLGLIMYALK